MDIEDFVFFGGCLLAGFLGPQSGKKAMRKEFEEVIGRSVDFSCAQVENLL